MRITARPDLSKLTTLKLGGLALAEILVEREEDFPLLHKEIARFGGTPKILGGGSNLLVQDGELPLVLVRPLLGREEKPRIIGEEDDNVLVNIKAGAPVPGLVAWCGKEGLSGLEGLVGIPGTWGGAVAMNAGAYGTETGNRLHSVLAWSPAHGLFVAGPGDWTLSYRHFALDGEADAVIVSTVVALRKSTADEVTRGIAENLERKKSTQPLGALSAGCVFKNPGTVSAGKLLDDAGMRGRILGGMWFTDKHANFLANRGGGTFREAMDLIEEARQQVARLFGIHLDLELRVWTCPS